MSHLTEQILELMDQCDEEEKRTVLDYFRHRVAPHPLEHEWGTTAHAILTAIARSSDLTKRGVRGILAEATFEETALATSILCGWSTLVFSCEGCLDFAPE